MAPKKFRRLRRALAFRWRSMGAAKVSSAWSTQFCLLYPNMNFQPEICQNELHWAQNSRCPFWTEKSRKVLKSCFCVVAIFRSVCIAVIGVSSCQILFRKYLCSPFARGMWLPMLHTALAPWCIQSSQGGGPHPGNGFRGRVATFWERVLRRLRNHFLDHFGITF